MARHSLRLVLVLVLATLCFVWLATRPSSNVQVPFIEDYSLSVILPVISSTLASLDDLLAPFLVSSTIIYEVAIVCPHPLVADIQRKLPAILSNATLGHPKLTLYPWSGLVHHHLATLQTVARIKTEYILILDVRGLSKIAECDRTYLVHPRAVRLPVGPHGYVGSHPDWTQLTPSDRVQPAVFLVPPFVAPSSVLAEIPLNFHSSLDWSLVGNHIAETTSGSFGGIVIGADILGTVACNPTTESNATSSGENSVDSVPSGGSFPVSSKGFFVLAFPRKQDLRDFIPAACRLSSQGYTVFGYIYDLGSSDVAIESNCAVPHFELFHGVSRFSDWLKSLGSVPDVIIALDHRDLVSSSFSLVLEQPPFLNTTLIRLPRHQLRYTEWIGTLTLHELRCWNVPEITLSVITNNRPHSLQRLLDSIQHTLFYGDRINIRINMEQTSDPETIRFIQNLEWSHGDVFLHHRVVRGGLLPAVVEAWYPHRDDSYGLLLEDDIELSPLSYAWIKMTLLRYKYGASSAFSSKLFGISLYPQKIIELRPVGRQPFDARVLFQSVSLPDPSTPYLSQIPCSWGALYFPVPWREFHDYLSLRLSQHALPIRGVIVPGVRSNKWTKSWKKYFIELVYLRGYVMLYPNYPDFVSLSTNHLEVGSHVKDEPEAVYEKKKPLFSLPLMGLAGGLAGSAPGPRLLDLPSGTLPDWEHLPVLDLWGELASIDIIERRGIERKSELGDCPDVEALPSSVRDLLCHVSL